MSRVALFGSAIAMAAAPVTAAPKPAIVLAPASKWNLHYADQSCQLKRAFGDPANPTSLIFERVGPGSAMSMMVVGDPLKARMGTRESRAAFLPFADQRFEQGDAAETVEFKKVAIVWGAVDFRAGLEKPQEPKPGEPIRRDPAKIASERATETANAAKVTGLEITEPGGRRILLQTGAMDKVMEAMRGCAREQLAAWGIDPDVEDRIVKEATARQPLNRLFSSSDYPSDAIRMGAQAMVKARLNIDAEGRVTNCTSLTAYRTPGFAEVSCKRLSAAKFLPAELADGTKVASYTVTNIRFQIP